MLLLCLRVTFSLGTISTYSVVRGCFPTLNCNCTSLIDNRQVCIVPCSGSLCNSGSAPECPAQLTDTTKNEAELFPVRCLYSTFCLRCSTFLARYCRKTYQRTLVIVKIRIKFIRVSPILDVLLNKIVNDITMSLHRTICLRQISKRNW